VRACLAGAAVFLALLGCASPVHTALYDSPWIEVRTANLTLWTNVHERMARRLARNLELFRSVVEYVIGQPLPRARLPLRMIHFGDVDTYSQFAPPGSAGVYLPSMRENVLLSTGSQMHVIQHEYTHFLLDNHSSLVYPPWYHEGFAEFLGATRHRALDVEVGGVSPLGPPLLAFRGRDVWTPVHELLAFGVGGHDDAPVTQLYQESWALVHYLYFGRGTDANGARQVGRYLRAIEQGQDIADAVESAFGVTVAELDRRLQDYVEANRYQVLILNAETFGAQPEPVVKPLDTLDVAVQLGELAATEATSRRQQHEWGGRHQTPERMAHQYFDEVLAARPGDDRARVGKARLAVSANPDPEIEATLEQALASDPNAWTHLMYGNVLLEWASGAADPAARARLAQRAREQYVASSELDASIPEPHARYGQTFLLEGQRAGDGLDALERAHSLLPASVEIMSLLAHMHQKLGDAAQARRFALAAYSTPRYGSGLTREDVDGLRSILESTGGVPRGGDD
jgi:hypothetical protein